MRGRCAAWQGGVRHGIVILAAEALQLLIVGPDLGGQAVQLSLLGGIGGISIPQLPLSRTAGISRAWDVTREHWSRNAQPRQQGSLHSWRDAHCSLLLQAAV